jgi:hypothetical protein
MMKEWQGPRRFVTGDRAPWSKPTRNACFASERIEELNLLRGVLPMLVVCCRHSAPVKMRLVGKRSAAHSRSGDATSAVISPRWGATVAPAQTTCRKALSFLLPSSAWHRLICTFPRFRALPLFGHRSRRVHKPVARRSNIKIRTARCAT